MDFMERFLINLRGETHMDHDDECSVMSVIFDIKHVDKLQFEPYDDNRPYDLLAKRLGEAGVKLMGVDAWTEKIRKARLQSVYWDMGMPPEDVIDQGRPFACMTGTDFRETVTALRCAVAKDSARPLFQNIQMFLNRDKVKGYTCDGYTLMVHETTCHCFGAPIMAFIPIPRILPKKDEKVWLQLSEDEQILLINFSEITLRFKQPKYKEHKTPMTMAESMSPVLERDFNISVDPSRMKLACECIANANTFGHIKPRMNMGIAGPTDAIVFQSSRTYGLVMPIRSENLENPRRIKRLLAEGQAQAEQQKAELERRIADRAGDEPSDA